MKPNYVTSKVDLLDSEIKVSITNSTTDPVSIKFGEILLLAHYIMRVGVLLKRGAFKSEYITSLSDCASVGAALDASIKYYAKYIAKSNRMSIGEGASGISKKGFTFEIAFNDEKHETKFSPRGFGIFGKYIEASSVLSVLIVAQFLITKYKGDREMMKILDETIKSSSQYLQIHSGELSVQDEYDMAERLAKEIL